MERINNKTMRWQYEFKSVGKCRTSSMPHSHEINSNKISDAFNIVKR